MKRNLRTERAWWTLGDDALESAFGADLPDWLRLWHSLLNHCRHWPLPPRWSAADWASEVEDAAVLAALEARKTFDPQRGVALPMFVKWRVYHALLARYRQEYRFGRDCPGELPADLLPNTDDDTAVTEGQRRALSVARAQLASDDQELLCLLYDTAETEASLAIQWGISQQAISKRKLKALNSLRHILEKSS